MPEYQEQSYIPHSPDSNRFAPIVEWCNVAKPLHLEFQQSVPAPFPEFERFQGVIR